MEGGLHLREAAAALLSPPRHSWSRRHRLISPLFLLPVPHPAFAGGPPAWGISTSIGRLRDADGPLWRLAATWHCGCAGVPRSLSTCPGAFLFSSPSPPSPPPVSFLIPPPLTHTHSILFRSRPGHRLASARVAAVALASTPPASSSATAPPLHPLRHLSLPDGFGRAMPSAAAVESVEARPPPPREAGGYRGGKFWRVAPVQVRRRRWRWV